MAMLPAFGGIIPRTPWHTLPDNAATYAHNVKLRNGKLEAWRERKPLSFGVTGALTLYMYDCCALTWADCISVAEYLPDYGRFFITGRQDYAETAILLDSGTCEVDYYRLGVPPPNSYLTYSGTEAYNRDAAARSYVYTYMNKFGEEGQPSYPGSTIVVVDGSTVIVNGFTEPTGEYGVISIRLYRSATGYRTGAEKEQELISDYLLVAELPLGTTSYTDSISDANLGPALSTRENRQAPDGLRHIGYLEGTGTLVGVTSNQVHFTKNMQPWNWPAEYDLTLPHNIVGMTTLNNFVFVTTDSYAFVIDGKNDCEVRQCRPTEGGDYPIPDISCGYPNSSIATPFGMIYSSMDGLILLKSDTRFDVITAQFFGTDEWKKIRPDTVRLAYWRGYLICVTDVLTFMLELDGTTYADYQLGALVTLSDSPVDMNTTNNGELLMLENGIIYQWEAGDDLREYEWISRELGFSGYAGPNTAKIRTDEITFTVYGQDTKQEYTTKVFSDRAVRIGRLGRNLNYRFGFRGTGFVESAQIGTALVTVNGGV